MSQPMQVIFNGRTYTRAPDAPTETALERLQPQIADSLSANFSGDCPGLAPVLPTWVAHGVKHGKQEPRFRCIGAEGSKEYKYSADEVVALAQKHGAHVHWVVQQV